MAMKWTLPSEELEETLPKENTTDVLQNNGNFHYLLRNWNKICHKSNEWNEISERSQEMYKTRSYKNHRYQK